MKRYHGTNLDTSTSVENFRPTDLSSHEVQAMLANPKLDEIPQREAAHAIATIFHTTAENVEGWHRWRGNDAQDVATDLLAHLNEWRDSLQLGATQNGGVQKMLNVRLHELACGKFENGKRKTDKDGKEIPALCDFGLDVTCALIPGPRGRKWSYYRICRASEIIRDPRTGRKRPFTPTTTRKPASAAPAPAPQVSAPLAPASEAAQESLFGLAPTTWADPEQGRRRA